MKKILIPLFFVLSIVFVNGDISTDVIGCFDFDNDYTDTTSTRNAGSIGTVSFSSGTKKLGTHSAYLNDLGAITFEDLTGTEYDLDYNTYQKTYCMWALAETHAGDDPLLTVYEDGVNVGHMLLNRHGTGLMMYQYSTAYVGNFPLTFGGEITDSNWHFLCFGVNGTNKYYAVNNANRYHVTGTDIDRYDNNLSIGGYEGAYIWDGYIDGFVIYNKTLDGDDLASLYNSGSGLTCADITGVDDTTPPSITNINQDPENLTIFNALEDGLYINATITDGGDGLNTSEVWLNLTTEHIEVWINGVNNSIGNNNQLYAYNHSGSDIYHWFIDENIYLSATRNLPDDAFDEQTLLNDTLDTANQWLKIRFYNVSNATNLVFTEIMDDNTTSTDPAEYYYCNSGYTTGNPVSDSDCVKFFTQTGNDEIHPHKGGRYHRVMPLNINITTGELNGIKITPLSYILKRGTADSERYYYIVNDTSSAETSNNNGNSWSAETYTVNAHIHQIHFNETIYYSICAEDNAQNNGCSAVFNDTVDFETLPPTPVVIINPISEQSYNDSILVNWSQSVSVSGQDIVNYTLYYRLNSTSTWTELEVINHPTTQYSWDISNRANAGYDIRIITYDSIGLQSVSFVENFIIANEETLNTQLLTSIDSTLGEILEILNMIPIIALYIGLLALGFWAVINYAHAYGLLLVGVTIPIDLYLWITYHQTAWYLGVVFAVVLLLKPILILFFRSKKNRPIYI